MTRDDGRSGTDVPSGSREPSREGVSAADAASIPNAGEEAYCLNPHFRRLMEVVKPVGLAAIAWGIVKEAFAPSDPDGEAEYEVWQDDEMVAGCSGPRGRSLAEAIHYAVVYQTDEKPCVIQEVTRREIDPDLAHSILASAMSAGTAETAQQAQGQRPASATGEAGDAQ